MHLELRVWFVPWSPVPRSRCQAKLMIKHLEWHAYMPSSLAKNYSSGASSSGLEQHLKSQRCYARILLSFSPKSQTPRSHTQLSWPRPASLDSEPPWARDASVSPFYHKEKVELTRILSEPQAQGYLLPCNHRTLYLALSKVYLFSFSTSHSRFNTENSSRSQ